MIYTHQYYPEYKIGIHSYGKITIHGNGSVDSFNYVEIGDYCSFAPGLQLQLGGNHPMESATTYPFRAIAGQPPILDRKYGIYIGNDVWTGLDVLIRHGVTVGDGAVIGMGSVVLHDVPPYAIVAGNPARLIRYRFPQDTITSLLKIKWWEWDYPTILSRLDKMDDVATFVRTYS
jgi:acetyltransferase-like isoleucine patch superfamily enzyme